MLNARVLSTTLGIIFVAVGLVGFIPNPLVSGDGLFVTNGIHNVVHILTGVAFFAILWAVGKESRLIVTVGIAYAVVALLGFLTDGDYLLGIVHINQADRWLHAALAAAIILAGAVASNPTTSADS